jgi:site-specific DNA-cytosine methylase
MELTKNQTNKGRKEIVMLNLFSGLGGGRLSAERAGLKVKTEYYSEVDPYALKVMKKRFPDSIPVGDVRNLKAIDFVHVTMITAGSPCQNFSLMGSRNGMATKIKELTDLKSYTELKKNNHIFTKDDGDSYLFWEFVRLYREIKALQIKMGLPVLDFLLENVKMATKWENVITTAMGVNPIVIDAALVSAQNRVRLFWTSLEGVTQPKDLNIKLGDVVKNAICGAGFRGRKINGVYEYFKTYTKQLKSNTIVTSLGNNGKKSGTDKRYGTGYYLTKKGNVELLKIEHIEILQCLEKGYTNVKGVSNTQRIRMIGNAWCIGVTSHIMKFYK